MFILPLVCIFKTRVPKHQQLHNDTKRKHVSLFSVIRFLLVNLWACLHPSPRYLLRAIFLLLPSKPIISKTDDELLI